MAPDSATPRPFNWYFGAHPFAARSTEDWFWGRRIKDILVFQVSSPFNWCCGLRKGYCNSQRTCYPISPNMRLLHTKTMKLRSFQRDVPPYAILSHVWGEEEVTFQDIADLNKATIMHGYGKIASACSTAEKDRLEYIWIDTCCINKDSSAELSEAINSMYKWYKNADVCYVYLSDVPSEGDHGAPHSLFAMSRWFTRGWTLQELIAPTTIIFYARDWVDIGTKATLQDTIHSATGISPDVIVGEAALDDIPVAVRMSWAADRNTTREEDVAYSLMGIFDIYMPLLYGEGTKAFVRLQHEIIRKSTDHSIFAWTEVPPPTYNPDVHNVETFDGEIYDEEMCEVESYGCEEEATYRGILARSPNEFRGSSDVIRIYSTSEERRTHVSQTLPYAITNSGLHIELPIFEDSEDPECKSMVFLNCRFSWNPEPIIITLSQPHFHHSGAYLRSETGSLERTSTKAGPPILSSIYIVDDYSLPDHTSEEFTESELLLLVTLPAHYVCPHIEPIDCYKMRDMGGKTSFNHWSLPNTPREAALVFEDHEEFGQFAVISGIGRGGMLWCSILSGVEPKDEALWQNLNAYRSSYGKGGIHWTEKIRFLDRASKNLKNGWSVTAKSFVNDTTAVYIDLKKDISESFRLSAALPQRLNKQSVFFLVIPPAPGHGYVVDATVPQESGIWTEHPGCFILSTSPGIPGVLAFKKINSTEQFFLLILLRGNILKSAIEEKRPTDLRQAIVDKDRFQLGFSYSAVLSQGNVVFVTIRIPRDRSVADYIITLSMKKKYESDDGHRMLEGG
ncbi:heterokaryon incompatibility protein-domain-containing protein [Collybia nuda]|uniref:Heterokaryon incompatibility protein-domain-containing protein n=1 Tax=Collybia nuda TaxID=64659 RepID=A0A9P5Y2R5_9AGAR|nr:heterokaryon incompatibility protein-domain-containing protein [Collybia nuda]